MITLRTPRDIISPSSDSALKQHLKENTFAVRKDLESLLKRMRFGIPKRQTVLTGKLDTTVYPSLPTCLAINGSAIDVKASETEPLVISFADGYDEYGGRDVVKSVVADVASAWSGFQSRQRYFLYADIDDDGVLTWGKTIIPPQYGTFNRFKHALLHFEGADGTYVFTDEWGDTDEWDRIGNAQIDTDYFKFGSSSLYLDGTGDGILWNRNILCRNRWTIEAWFRPDRLGVSQVLYRHIEPYSIAVSINATGYLVMNVSTTGSTWPYSGTAVTNPLSADGNFYHVAIEQVYDETNDLYYWIAYVDGNIVLTLGGTALGIYDDPQSNGFRIGIDYAGGTPYQGWVDEFRYSAGFNRYGGVAFTPSSAAFGMGDGDVHWFNIDRMEMNVGYPASWTKKKRVFLGDFAAAWASSSPERLSVYTYLNRYISAVQTCTAVGTDFFIEHNCGIPIGQGLIPFLALSSAPNMVNCYVDYDNGSSGYGFYQGYALGDDPFFEAWRHYRHRSSTTRTLIWDLVGGWSVHSKMQMIFERMW